MAKLSTAARSWTRQFDYNGSGILLTIGGVPNPRVEKFYATLDPETAKLLRASQDSGIPSGPDMIALRKTNIEMVASCILVGWDNLEDDDGKPIPYSVEKAIELLSDEKNYDLLHFVQEAAGIQGEHVAKRRKESLGNLNGSSSGV